MKGESHFRPGGPPKMSTKLSNLREQGERGGGVGERGGGEGERGRNRQERKGERRGR